MCYYFGLACTSKLIKSSPNAYKPPEQCSICIDANSDSLFRVIKCHR